jgi:hypothetical protein
MDIQRALVLGVMLCVCHMNGPRDNRWLLLDNYGKSEGWHQVSWICNESVTLLVVRFGCPLRHDATSVTFYAETVRKLQSSGGYTLSEPDAQQSIIGVSHTFVSTCKCKGVSFEIKLNS